MDDQAIGHGEPVRLPHSIEFPPRLLSVYFLSDLNPINFRVFHRQLIMVGSRMSLDRINDRAQGSD